MLASDAKLEVFRRDAERACHEQALAFAHTVRSRSRALQRLARPCDPPAPPAPAPDDASSESSPPSSWRFSASVSRNFGQSLLEEEEAPMRELDPALLASSSEQLLAAPWAAYSRLRSAASAATLTRADAALLDAPFGTRFAHASLRAEHGLLQKELDDRLARAPRGFPNLKKVYFSAAHRCIYTSLPPRETLAKMHRALQKEKVAFLTSRAKSAPSSCSQSAPSLSEFFSLSLSLSMLPFTGNAGAGDAAAVGARAVAPPRFVCAPCQSVVTRERERERDLGRCECVA